MFEVNPAVFLEIHKTNTFQRPALAGKFLFEGEQKLIVQGVTYGPFSPGPAGEGFPDASVVNRDLSQMAACGFNSIRTYTVPPRWFLDLAQEHHLRVMVGIPWEQHVAFLESRRQARRIEAHMRTAVAGCCDHPAVLCYAIGNEIPAPIVRWHGRRAIERHLQNLYQAAKESDPDSLVTYVSYPTTEYLDLPFLDLVCFNVYLERQEQLEAYLARLHNLAGDRPLLLAEIGLDSRRHGESRQAQVLDWQVRTTMENGCAGAFVFAWTDEWHRGGCEIDDWDFGLTSRDRQSKQALGTVSRAFAEPTRALTFDFPRVSVIVCSYNGSRTIRDCLEGISTLTYPNYEVIVVDDGSTDDTAQIASHYPVRLIRTPNEGLSNARNLGLKEAMGEIVAYLDDDAWPDPDWLTHLVRTFRHSEQHVGVGGPNIAPRNSGIIADCVANAPGGPCHVLLTDKVAEHIPGCNMAFRKEALETIGGFDGQFRTAGDDVDICWRLQARGGTIGFNAAAMVWHHRRSSIRAYLQQQRGYGKAEALLERKWPEKYSVSGNACWEGRIYGRGLLRALGFQSRIYHGTWGSAPFQRLYEPALTVWSSLPEWYVLCLCSTSLAMLGFMWTPLFWVTPVTLLTLGVPVVQAISGARHAMFTVPRQTRWRRLQLRSLTALLYLLQPIARLTGRLKAGLHPMRSRLALRPSWPWPVDLRFWNEPWSDPQEMLRAVERFARMHGALVTRGGDFDRWDLAITSGLFSSGRLLMGVEEHGGGKQLVRFKIWPSWRPAAFISGGTMAGLAVAASWTGVWMVGAMLLLIAALPLGQGAWVCGQAITVFRQSLNQTWPSGPMGK